MSCIINNGYALSCASIGGVEKVYIGTYVPTQTYSMDANNVITGATTGSTVYLIEQDMEFAGLSQNGVFSRENGTVHFETILSVKMIDVDAELRNTVLALAKAPIFAVIKSNSGKYFIAGVESAGRATEGVLSLGTAMADLNGSTLSFTFKSQNGVYLMEEWILGTQIAIG